MFGPFLYHFQPSSATFHSINSGQTRYTTFFLENFPPKTSRKSWDSWNRPEPVPNIDALSRQLSKKKTSFLCSPANKFRWFPSPWGCESARPFQWRITLKRASMARYLDILVSYKYYFINLPQKKKRKKLRPSKWPGKYQRAFSVATRH